VRRGIRVNNPLAMANGSITLAEVAAHTEVMLPSSLRAPRGGFGGGCRSEAEACFLCASPQRHLG
jgi:hypothetical protein